MKVHPILVSTVASLLMGACPVSAKSKWPKPQSIELTPIGTVSAGPDSFDKSAAEIVAHDPEHQRLFVVNSQKARVDVVDISDPTDPKIVKSALDATSYGKAANSVAVKNGLIAIAVEATVKTDPGTAVFFDTDLNFLSAVPVGALPDNIVFTPDGKKVLVANEGEPNDDYSIDPEGTVSIIDVSKGAAALTAASVKTADFKAFNNWIPRGVRISGPNATNAQDLEPEFIAVSENSRFAWVTLQENNAVAILDINAARVIWISPLGTKDHSRKGNGLDASDKDKAINIATWPIRGLYMPDGIATFRHGPFELLITANEGDTRDYSGFSDEGRIKDAVLDPKAFPNAAALQDDKMLGRLKYSTVDGDRDGDDDIDTLYTFGARSFSIRTTTGFLLYDSGDDFEQIIAEQAPEAFNVSNDNNTFDNRSDDKGPEPEGVVVGEVGGRTYAFIGLERVGGVMVYDITNPVRPEFVQWANNRNYVNEDGSEADPEAPENGDLGPEGLVFIPAAQSPNGKPLLAVGNEVSGTTTIYEINPAPGK